MGEKFTRQAMSNAVRTQLARLGWTIEDGTALVKKVYHTAAGNRDAFVYLADYGQDSDSFLLTGSYWSEGRNCLEPHPVPIPKSGCLDVVKERVIQFASQAEAAIAETYARRLHLRWGSVNQFRLNSKGAKHVSGNRDL